MERKTSARRRDRVLRQATVSFRRGLDREAVPEKCDASVAIIEQVCSGARSTTDVVARHRIYRETCGDTVYKATGVPRSSVGDK